PAQQHEADDEQERRIEQERWMRQRQITVHETEQDQPEAVARIEPHPGFPHRRFACDDGRNRTHSFVKLRVTWQELRSAERVKKMHQAEQKRNCGASRQQIGGKLGHAAPLRQSRPARASNATATINPTISPASSSAMNPFGAPPTAIPRTRPRTNPPNTDAWATSPGRSQASRRANSPKKTPVPEK